MRRRFGPGIALMVLAACCGCRLFDPSVVRHPGWIDQQRARAERFDPYPEPIRDSGGPDMDGTRPRDYLTPPGEVKKVQNASSEYHRYQDPLRGQ